MKIAVARTGSQVSGHFGHCEDFLIVTAENGTVVTENSVTNPGHKPGFLPNFLGDMGVNVIIAGGMGSGAADIFAVRNVEVVTGASGDAHAAVEAYLKGGLKSTGAICTEHHHEHGHEHGHEGGCKH